MGAEFPEGAVGRHLAWYFEVRVRGRATQEEIEEHFAPEYRWDWGSPRDERALELWFQRWRNIWAEIESIEDLGEDRYLVVTRVGGGGVARIWFEMEPGPPHRISRTSTSEAKHAGDRPDVDRDTAVAAGRASIHPGFTTAAGPFGGYLAALALRGAGTATALAVPRSMTCQFLDVGRSGEIEVHAVALRESRRLAQIRVDIVQGGTRLLAALVVASATSMSTGDTAPGADLAEPSPPGRGSTSLFRGAVELRVAGTADGAMPTEAWCRTPPSPAGEDPWLDCARLLLPFDWLAVRSASTIGRPASPTAGGEQLQSLDTTFMFVNPDMHTAWVFGRGSALAGDADVAVTQVDFWSESGDYLGRGSQQVLRRPVARR